MYKMDRNEWFFFNKTVVGDNFIVNFNDFEQVCEKPKRDKKIMTSWSTALSVLIIIIGMVSRVSMRTYTLFWTSWLLFITSVSKPWRHSCYTRHLLRKKCKLNSKKETSLVGRFIVEVHQQKPRNSGRSEICSRWKRLKGQN